MNNDFTTLGLQPELVQAVTDLGYSEPTPIQMAAIPILLDGKDMIGQAQTGTGKTAAFALPILQNITLGTGNVQALIVAPTRELAMQVSRAIHNYGESVGGRVLAVYGGQPYSRQIRRLQKGVDVVVGTPGRLLDLIKRKSLRLHALKMVVLDEADEMLSMGFIEDIEAILNETPKERQTALFSATMPKEIRRLADTYLTNPETATMPHKQLTVAAIEQRYYLINQRDKLGLLTRLFEVEEMQSALIFARTRVGTGELAHALNARGFAAEPLSGDLSQDARERVMNRFRSGKLQVLVATDVAARGLDIDDISHVFNFDLPYDTESYVHRIGRTGRAGRTGVAISLITPNEQWRLRKIETYTKQKMVRGVIPTEEEILSYRESQLLERMMVWIRRGRCRREREMIEKVMAESEEELELIDVAAAALKLGRAEEKQRPIARISPVNERRPSSYGDRRRSGPPRGRQNERPGKNAREKGMVRLIMNAGKAQGVRPNDVVGTIAYHANIPGRTLGAIRIQEQHTVVDVPENFVAKVLAQSGEYRLGKQRLTIKKS